MVESSRVLIEASPRALSHLIALGACPPRCLRTRSFWVDMLYNSCSESKGSPPAGVLVMHGTHEYEFEELHIVTSCPRRI